MCGFRKRCSAVAPPCCAVSMVRVDLARYASLSHEPVGATLHAYMCTRRHTHTHTSTAYYLCLTGPQNPRFVLSVMPNLANTAAQTRSAVVELLTDADILRGEKSIATGQRLGFSAADLHS